MNEVIEETVDVAAGIPGDAETCAECGFALSSEQHIRGIGLHGHQCTSKAEADAQREDVMRRAHEFAERMKQEEATANLRTALEAMSPDEVSGLLQDMGIAVSGETKATEPRPKTLSEMNRGELELEAMGEDIDPDQYKTNKLLADAIRERRKAKGN